MARRARLQEGADGASEMRTNLLPRNRWGKIAHARGAGSFCAMCSRDTSCPFRTQSEHDEGRGTSQQAHFFQ